MGLPGSAVIPEEMIFPAFTTTAPTMGFGLVRPAAFAASRRAMAMYFLSKHYCHIFAEGVSYFPFSFASSSSRAQSTSISWITSLTERTVSC